MNHLGKRGVTNALVWARGRLGLCGGLGRATDRPGSRIVAEIKGVRGPSLTEILAILVLLSFWKITTFIPKNY